MPPIMEKETISFPENPDTLIKNSCEVASTEKSTTDLSSCDENDQGCYKSIRRIARISDSDSDNNKENNHAKYNSRQLPSDSESDDQSLKKKSTVKPRTRIRNYSSSSSDSNESMNYPSAKDTHEQRMTNKRNKVRNKFRYFLDSRAKTEDLQLRNSDQGESQTKEDIGIKVLNIKDSSQNSIKQNFQENTNIFKSICDPDTSEDEENPPKKKTESKKKNIKKTTILTSPKPVRVSAKQALDNMQKIKSESNRMLREKEVSLPYHKPKAISLKDIMSRRKPAIGTDGKALRINMNDDQLKIYVSMLEQRQKEIIELCKSDSEDEQEIAKENTQGKIVYSDGHLREISVVEGKHQKELGLNVNYAKINEKVCESSSKDCNSIIDGEMTVQSNNDILEKNNLNIPIVQPNLGNNISLNEANLNLDDTKKLTCQDSPERNKNICIKATDSMTLNADIGMNDKTCIIRNQIEIVNETDSYIDSKKDDNEEMLQNHNPHIEHVESYHNYSEPDSQLVTLHYDTEKYDQIEIIGSTQKNLDDRVESTKFCEITDKVTEDNNFNIFSDDELNIDDIDKLIENAEIIKDTHEYGVNSSMLPSSTCINKTPKITGTPGTVIDLDGNNPTVPKKLSGVDLLKERFTYFATLKTSEETERAKEKKIKPGTLHLKLKKELEEKIAEQRSLEWERRLQEIKQLQDETDAIMANNSDQEDDIEKVEAELEKQELCDRKEDMSDSVEESEPEENDVYIADKPRKKNPLLDEEAEESDVDENNKKSADEAENSDNYESSDEESSESEDENQEVNPLKKGRILKAFEDSDDEIADKEDVQKSHLNKPNEVSIDEKIPSNIDVTEHSEINLVKMSQDDELQLAQKHNSLSEDLFTSQESAVVNMEHTLTARNANNDTENENDLGTQTFSILDTKLANPDKIHSDVNFPKSLDVLSDGYVNINYVMGAENISQNLQSLESQPFGEDVLALCTGNFYDNQFISQADGYKSDKIAQQTEENFSNKNNTSIENLKFIETNINKGIIKTSNERSEFIETNIDQDTIKTSVEKAKLIETNIDKDILEELNNPEFDKPKQNIFFTNGNNETAGKTVVNNFIKKKLIIDSDDEDNEVVDTDVRKIKKLIKKKIEKRVLQISDDEEDGVQEVTEDLSDYQEEESRLIEYDSEENEIEILPEKKKKRKMADFFEQEAELTSEDEWVGSGDEDEAGLDRMEREEGDDEIFHQGKLQRELGQIHMRDVMDQDKREVRIIQELLFEDGDLGDGHRQRKFRWRNADGEEEVGTMPDEFLDTQEEEFESEEQWRKQRHEREVFLRQLKVENEPEDSPNVTLNRSTIIKAGLCSKTMSSLVIEVNTSTAQKTESPVEQKKTAKDIPSPKKPFAIFQQAYHGSLLSRGQTALARLAALATPLATEDDAKVGSLAPASKRNFVFASVTIEDDEPKATKRKADKSVDTPKLLKKMKVEERKHSRNSLLDHLR